MCVVFNLPVNGECIKFNMLTTPFDEEKKLNERLIFMTIYF